MNEGNDYAMCFQSDGELREAGKAVPIECAKLEVHKHPRERKYCEVHIEFSEHAGDDSRTLSISTFMTQKDLRRMARELKGGAE